jgi:photosystem II stability/assembly factor-like uncharacterized protein
MMTMNRGRLAAAVASGLALACAGALAASAAVSGAGLAGTGSVRPAVGPVPAGFRPDSMTFISASEGWVLGTAPCAHAPCTSVVRTTNGGRSWVGIPAPRFKLAPFIGGPGLIRMRFADSRDGFAYGSQLWVTHNGGARWGRLTQVPGYIADLEASAGSVYAASVRSGRMTIYRTPAGRNAWRRVAGLPTITGQGGLGTITLHGKAAWIILGTRVYASPTGARWAREGFRCRRNFGISSVAAFSTRDVTLLCSGNAALGSTQKVVYASANGGVRYTKVGNPPSGGDGGVLAEPTTRHLFIATASAASWLYASTDGGHRWHTSLFRADGGEGWNDFGFTTSLQGVAVEGRPAIGSHMYITRNGGTSWHRVTF